MGACRGPEDRLYMITEYLAGGDLSNLLNKKPLPPWHERLKIVVDVARLAFIAISLSLLLLLCVPDMIKRVSLFLSLLVCPTFSNIAPYYLSGASLTFTASL